jgi:hypothetical protein
MITEITKLVELLVLSGFCLYVVQTMKALSVEIAKLQGSQEVLLKALEKVERLGVVEAKTEALHRRLDDHQKIDHN